MDGGLSSKAHWWKGFVKVIYQWFEDDQFTLLSYIQECASGGISRQKFCQMILCEVELGPKNKKDSCPSVYLEQNTTSR